MTRIAAWWRGGQRYELRDVVGAVITAAEAPVKWLQWAKIDDAVQLRLVTVVARRPFTARVGLANRREPARISGHISEVRLRGGGWEFGRCKASKDQG